MLVNELPRVFVHEEDSQKIKLSDPDDRMTPEAVLEFYSNTYPILVTAKISGPEIEGDEVVYSFITTMGTKG